MSLLTFNKLFSAMVPVLVEPIDLTLMPPRADIDLPGAVFRLSSLASMYDPYLKNKEVKHYIKHFRRPAGLRFIRESLERGAPYIPYIMRKLEEYHLPYELIYLPILESGYRLHAVSPAKAVGPWQFIARYSKPYGLKINQWRDDRRDIAQATDAALKKLREEIQKTDDLWLAVAAYNGGITRVLRIKRELESLGIDPSFWVMTQNQMLPDETMGYVPKLIAISYVARYVLKFSPNQLRLDRSDESIVLLDNPGPISITDLANEIGVDEFELKTLNSGLIREKTPPAKDGYQIKVPAYAEDAAKEFLAKYSPARNRKQLESPAPRSQRARKKPAFKTYIVRKGDNLTKIGRKFGISQQAIRRMNPRITPNRIYPGQRLQIPT